MFDRQYEAQVKLMLDCLPEVARQRCFALKGGTAINLFLRDLPRVSVDIDLTYLPISPRDDAMSGIHNALLAIAEGIEQHVPDTHVQRTRQADRIVKLVVATANAQIKVEPNLLLRGTVNDPQNLDLCPTAQGHFQVFATVQVASVADLYGGKLCAALDRQHPRDLFDVKLLSDDTGITADIRRAFVVYLASHDRPMAELLSPKLRDITPLYDDQFVGMAREEVSVEELVEIQRGLADNLVTALDKNERTFLLSLKRGRPEWDLLDIPHLEQMPALQWKLINIRKMSREKHRAAVAKLEQILFPAQELYHDLP